MNGVDNQRAIDRLTVERVKRERDSSYDIRHHSQVSGYRANINDLLAVIERLERENFDLRGAVIQACDAAFAVHDRRRDLRAVRAAANNLTTTFSWDAVAAES